MKDCEWIGWTLIGVTAIIAIYLIGNLIYRNSIEGMRHDRAVKTAKIEACKTIPDQGMRTLCVVEGGAQ